MDFAGDFETHITLRAGDAAEVEAACAWAAARGLPFHHIVLDRGATPSQPMIGRRGQGGLADQIAAASELVRRLADAGFVAVRVKVEAAPWNRDVPATDAEAAALHPGRHFEHHVKLLLPPDADLAALAGLAQSHGARLSRNALRVRDDGRAERFVTRRCHAVGRPSARARLDALVAALRDGGYEVADVEEEYVVHDSHPGVDAGWLVPEEASR